MHQKTAYGYMELIEKQAQKHNDDDDDDNHDEKEIQR